MHPPAGWRKSTTDPYQSQKGRRQEGPCQEELTDLSLEKVQGRAVSTMWIWKLKQVLKGREGETNNNYARLGETFKEVHLGCIFQPLERVGEVIMWRLASASKIHQEGWF